MTEVACLQPELENQITFLSKIYQLMIFSEPCLTLTFVRIFAQELQLRRNVKQSSSSAWLLCSMAF